MIIKSYLAYPVEGCFAKLAQELRSIAACEVTSATNHKLLIVVTESSDDRAERALTAQIEALASLQSLTLVSGYNETVMRDEKDGSP